MSASFLMVPTRPLIANTTWDGVAPGWRKQGCVERRLMPQTVVGTVLDTVREGRAARRRHVRSAGDDASVQAAEFGPADQRRSGSVEQGTHCAVRRHSLIRRD